MLPLTSCCSLPPGLWPLLLEPDGGLPRGQGQVPQADAAAPAAVVLLQGQERPPGGVRPAPRQAGLPGAILPQRVRPQPPVLQVIISRYRYTAENNSSNPPPLQSWRPPVLPLEGH